MQLGLDPGYFWTITPRELRVIFAGAVRRIEPDAARKRAEMYGAAVLTRAAYHAKEFPSFERVFAQERRKQSPKEILATMQAIFASTPADKGRAP